MSKLTLDEIYGLDLGEYLILHNKTKQDLINEIKIDINILTKSYRRYADHNQNYTVPELIKYGVPVQKLIEKKRKHLERIQNWTT